MHFFHDTHVPNLVITPNAPEWAEVSFTFFLAAAVALNCGHQADQHEDTKTKLHTSHPHSVTGLVAFTENLYLEVTLFPFR